MSQPILTRDGLTALRQLHRLLPHVRPETLLDVAAWAIDLADIKAAPLRPDLAAEARGIFHRSGDTAGDVVPATEPDLPTPGPSPEAPQAAGIASASSVSAPCVSPSGRPGWPEADIVRLRALVDQGLGWAEIGRAMDRDAAAVRVYALRHGIGIRKKVASDWSDEHNATLLRMLAEGHGVAEIGNAVDRSSHAVQSRIRKIRESKGYKQAMAARRRRQPDAPRAVVTRQSWTDADDARLRGMIVQNMDFRAIGQAMGRTAQSCESRFRKLRDRTRTPRPAWTEAEDRRLSAMRAEGHVPSAIAKALGRSERAVVQRAMRIKDAPPPAAPDPAPSVDLPEAPAPIPVVDAASPAVGTISMGPARSAADHTPTTAREQHIEAIRAHLDRMPWDERFDAATDYTIGQRLLAGTSSRALAEELGLTIAALADRFRAMIPGSIRDSRGLVTIDGRVLLLEALRRNAEEDEAEA